MQLLDGHSLWTLFVFVDEGYFPLLPVLKLMEIRLPMVPVRPSTLTIPQIGQVLLQDAVAGCCCRMLLQGPAAGRVSCSQIALGAAAGCCCRQDAAAGARCRTSVSCRVWLQYVAAGRDSELRRVQPGVFRRASLQSYWPSCRVGEVI